MPPWVIFLEEIHLKSVEVTGGRMVITLKWLPDWMRRKELGKATTAQELKGLL